MHSLQMNLNCLIVLTTDSESGVQARQRYGAPTDESMSLQPSARHYPCRSSPPCLTSRLEEPSSLLQPDSQRRGTTLSVQSWQSPDLSQQRQLATRSRCLRGPSKIVRGHSRQLRQSAAQHRRVLTWVYVLSPHSLRQSGQQDQRLPK